MNKIKLSMAGLGTILVAVFLMMMTAWAGPPNDTPTRIEELKQARDSLRASLDDNPGFGEREIKPLITESNDRLKALYEHQGLEDGIKFNGSDKELEQRLARLRQLKSQYSQRADYFKTGDGLTVEDLRKLEGLHERLANLDGEIRGLETRSVMNKVLRPSEMNEAIDDVLRRAPLKGRQYTLPSLNTATDKTLAKANSILHEVDVMIRRQLVQNRMGNRSGFIPLPKARTVPGPIKGLKVLGLKIFGWVITGGIDAGAQILTEKLREIYDKTYADCMRRFLNKIPPEELGLVIDEIDRRCREEAKQVVDNEFLRRAPDITSLGMNVIERANRQRLNDLRAQGTITAINSLSGKAFGSGLDVHREEMEKILADPGVSNDIKERAAEVLEKIEARKQELEDFGQRLDKREEEIKKAPIKKSLNQKQDAEPNSSRSTFSPKQGGAQKDGSRSRTPAGRSSN